jgi:hypothetical protein
MGVRRLSNAPPLAAVSIALAGLGPLAHRLWSVVGCFAVIGLIAVTPVAAQPSVDGPMPQPLPLFPADNWWNVDVSAAPPDPASGAYMNFVKNNAVNGRRVHPDFGGSAHDDDDPNAIYGIPYISVSGSQPLVPVTFVLYGNQSDVGAPGRPPGYPIPEQAKTQAGWIEGGAPGNQFDEGLDSNSGDRHMLIVDRDNKIVYELYQAHWNASRNRWEAGSGAVFPLTSNLRRPDTWTSADAAGLAILPGLVRYDEAYGTAPIEHAFRVTVRSTKGYVYPASHDAGDTDGALPMGARLRLKAGVDISGYPAPMQRVFQAMKTYGLIVADNGSDMFVTGASDPRWEPQMDDVVDAFHSLNSDQFEVVKLGWTPPVNVDEDHDGLPDDWEARYGLSPADATGANGPGGNPDGDAFTNLQELERGTHPNGRYQANFAEGASNAFFATRFALLNPGSQPAHVQFRYLRDSGQVVPLTVLIAPHSRYTENPANSVGELGAFSTIIESDQPIVADRTMTWDRTGYGATAETARPASSTSWFFAEGATAAFQLFYLIENPGDDEAQVTVRYLLPITPAFEMVYHVAPHSRLTIPVNDQDPRLASDEISAEMHSTTAVIAERAMYLTPAGGRPMDAGHASAGVTAAAPRWFLAEGATGFFSLFVLIANPSDDVATLDITYLLPIGAPLHRTMTVPPRSRRTIAVNDEEFPGIGKALTNTPVATVVTSVATPSVPTPVNVVVERSMWWPSTGWYEAHNSPGATSTSPLWASGEGESGGEFGAETYYLIANTSDFAGQARVTFMFEDGTMVADTVAVAANSRVTVAGGDVPQAAGKRYGVTVESLPQAAGGQTPGLVVERAMYWNANGLFWAAGTNSLLAPLSPPTP